MHTYRKGAEDMKHRIIDIPATSIHIRELIIARGYTMSDVRRLLNLLTVQAVYNWCSPKNKTLPDLQHMMQLADILECAIEELLVTKEVDLQEGTADYTNA